MWQEHVSNLCRSKSLSLAVNTFYLFRRLFLVCLVFELILHFLIHIDVLMLCRKLKPIPTSNFRVMAVLKNWPIFGKKHGL